MSGDDWLYDGTPADDPADAALVEALATLRYAGPTDADAAELALVAGRGRGAGWAVGRWALAASVLLAVGAGGVAWWLFPDVSPVDATDGWAYDAPDCRDDCVLRVGQWLDTGPSPTTLQVADIGTMDVAPGSRVRLVATGADEHRLELARGTVHAEVLAPPRLLIVDTPAVTAVDLGCAYDLAVDDHGAATLSVQSGWVALERPGRAVRVPAGASAATRPGEDPSTPVFDDAPAAVRDAAARLDGGHHDALAGLLASARARDTLTLWHVLPLLSEPRRLETLERMKQLTPWIQWRAVDVDGVAALDPDASDELLIELTTAFYAPEELPACVAEPDGPFCNPVPD